MYAFTTIAQAVGGTSGRGSGYYSTPLFSHYDGTGEENRTPTE